MFRLPNATDLRLTGVVFILFAMLTSVLGLKTGLFTFHVTSELNSILRTALITFAVPALIEEAVFRGPLILLKERLNNNAFLYVCITSLLLFVAWHPLNATFFLTAAQSTFFDWRFLMIAGLLGAGATILTIRTQTLWPAIIFHWAAVVSWKVFFGGPNFF